MTTKEDRQEAFNKAFETVQETGEPADPVADWSGEESASTIRLRPYRYDTDLDNKSSHEEITLNGTKKKVQKFNHYVADCGHRVAEPPGHPNLPYVAGVCREGHTACSNCLTECDICKTKICRHELWKYVDGKPICKKHSLRMLFESIIYFIFGIFFNIELEDDEPNTHKKAPDSE